MMTASHTQLNSAYDLANTARANGTLSDKLSKAFKCQLSDSIICGIFFQYLPPAISAISTLANAKPFDVFQEAISISTTDLSLQNIEHRYTSAAYFKASMHALEVMNELFEWLIQGDDQATIDSRKLSPRGKFILAMDKACWAILNEPDNQLRINSWVALHGVILAVKNSLISEPSITRKWFKPVISLGISVGLFSNRTVHFRTQIFEANIQIEKCITQEKIFQVKDGIKNDIFQLNLTMRKIASSAHRIISSLLMSQVLGETTTNCDRMFSKKIQFNNLIWLGIQEVTGVLTIKKSEYSDDQGNLTNVGKIVSDFNDNIKLLHGTNEIKPTQVSLTNLHNSESKQIALLRDRENALNSTESEKSFNQFISIIGNRDNYKNRSLVIFDSNKKKHTIASGFAPYILNNTDLFNDALLSLINFLKLLRAFLNCLARNEKYYEFFDGAGEKIAIALLAKAELCQAMEKESIEFSGKFISAIEFFYLYIDGLFHGNPSGKKLLASSYPIMATQLANIEDDVRKLKEFNGTVIRSAQSIQFKRINVEIKIQNGDDSLRSSTEQLLQDQRLYNCKQKALGLNQLNILTLKEEKDILTAVSVLDNAVRHAHASSDLRVKYWEPLRLTVISDAVAPVHEEKKETQTTSVVITALSSPRAMPLISQSNNPEVRQVDPVDPLLLSFTTTKDQLEITKNNKILTDMKIKLGYPNDNSLNPNVFKVFHIYDLPKRIEKKSEEKSSHNLFSSAFFINELNYQKTIATKLKSHWANSWLTYLNPITWFYRQWYGIPSLAVDSNNNRAARLAICEEMHSLFLRTLNNDGDGVIKVEHMLTMHAELKELLSSQKPWFRSSFNSNLSLLLNQIEEEKNNAILKFNYLQSIQEYLNQENQQSSSFEKNIDDLKNAYNELVGTNKHSLVARTLYVKNQIKDRLVFLVKAQHDAIRSEVANLSERMSANNFSIRVRAGEVAYQQQCADWQQKLVDIDRMMDDLKGIFEDASIKKSLRDSKKDVRELFGKIVQKENEEQIKVNNISKVRELKDSLALHMGLLISIKIEPNDKKYLILDEILDNLIDFTKNKFDFNILQEKIWGNLYQARLNPELLHEGSRVLMNEIWTALKLDTFQAASALKDIASDEKLIPLRVATTPQPPKLGNALPTNPGFFSLEATAAKSAADATRLIESALDHVNDEPKRSRHIKPKTFRPHLRFGC